MARKAAIEEIEMSTPTLRGLGSPDKAMPLFAALGCIGWSWIDFDRAYRLAWRGDRHRTAAIAETIELLAVHGYEVEGPDGAARVGPCLVDPSAPYPYTVATIAEADKRRRAIDVRRIGCFAVLVVVTFGLVTAGLGLTLGVPQLGMRELVFLLGCYSGAWLTLWIVIRRRMDWFEDQEPCLPVYAPDEVVDLQDVNPEWQGELRALEARRHEAAESYESGQGESIVAAQAIWDLAGRARWATLLEDEVGAASAALDSPPDYRVADGAVLRDQLDEANEALEEFRTDFGVEAAAIESRLVEAIDRQGRRHGYAVAPTKTSWLAHAETLEELTASLRRGASADSSAEARQPDLAGEY